jgi:hypothetical protein
MPHATRSPLVPSSLAVWALHEDATPPWHLYAHALSRRMDMATLPAHRRNHRARTRIHARAFGLQGAMACRWLARPLLTTATCVDTTHPRPALFLILAVVCLPRRQAASSRTLTHKHRPRGAMHHLGHAHDAAPVVTHGHQHDFTKPRCCFSGHGCL